MRSGSARRKEGRSTKGENCSALNIVRIHAHDNISILYIMNILSNIRPLFPLFSLLTLSQVLSKLGKKDRGGHINYRDSKLTRILKPSLSGNARMGCICGISPAMQYAEESKSTLDFAMRTMLVTTNAKRYVVHSVFLSVLILQ